MNQFRILKPLLALLVVLTMTNFSCYKLGTEMTTIANDSNKDVYVFLSFGNDSTLRYVSKDDRYLVKSHERKKVLPGICSERFNSISTATHEIHVHVVDKQVYDNNNWKKIKKDDLVLFRYNMTIEDLLKHNCVVSFP